MRPRPNVGYVLKNSKGMSILGPPQELKIYSILLIVWGTQSIADEPTIENALAIRNPGFFSTNQDVWKVFRRFRKHLIKLGVMEEVVVDPILALHERMRKEKA